MKIYLKLKKGVALEVRGSQILRDDNRQQKKKKKKYSKVYYFFFAV